MRRSLRIMIAHNWTKKWTEQKNELDQTDLSQPNPSSIRGDNPSDSSGVYTCKSVVNDLRHGNYIWKSEENLPDIRTSYWNSSGVYICKSVVNDLRHGNYICKSEEIYQSVCANCVISMIRMSLVTALS